MRGMKSIGLALLLFVTMGIGLSYEWNVANAAANKLFGEDPFPLSCANFTGMWQSDRDGLYRIEQDGCSWLVLRSLRDPELSMTILPDNKPRKVRTPRYTAIERHRWGAKRTMANELISERTIYLGGKIIRETSRFELIAEDYIEQSIVRTIDDLNDGSRIVDYDLVKYSKMYSNYSN